MLGIIYEYCLCNGWRLFPLSRLFLLFHLLFCKTIFLDAEMCNEKETTIFLSVHNKTIREHNPPDFSYSK